MVSDDRLAIVREWQVRNAPTGEGGRVMDQYGRVWAQTLTPGREGTGVETRIRTGNDLRPSGSLPAGITPNC